MQNLSLSLKALVIAVVLSRGQQQASAQIVADFHGGGQPGQNFFTSQISSTDLVEADSPYLASYTTTGAGDYVGYAGAFNDGTATVPVVLNDRNATDAFGNNVSVTFNLNTAIRSFGYSIYSINSYAGFSSQNFGVQSFDLKLQFVGSSTFVDYGIFTNNVGAADNFLNPLSTLTTLTGVNGAPIASGVSALRFTYSDTGGGTAAENIQEIDVNAVPEPVAFVLMLIGLVFLGWGLRRESAGR